LINAADGSWHFNDDCGDGISRAAHADTEAGYGSVVRLQCTP